LAEGTNLPIAAGARGVLERMVNDDSRSVASAAAEAVAQTALRLSATTVDLGSVNLGARSTADVSIEGVPLASASRVEASIPTLRVRRVERTIRIELDTSLVGPIDGIVTVNGPAGTSEVRVVGIVSAIPADSRRDDSRDAAAGGGPTGIEAATLDRLETARAEIAPEAAETQPVAATQRRQVKPEHLDDEATVFVARDGDAVVHPVPSSQAAETIAADRMQSATSDARIPAVERSIAQRAAARGFLGAVIGWSLGFAGVLALNTSEIDSFVESLDRTIPFVIGSAVAFAVVVAIAEFAVPSIRVPSGNASRATRGNRLGAAAIQGAVVAVTAGLAAYLLVGGRLEAGVIALLALGGAIGFALAESVLGRLQPAT
jgi:hypothetical protein